MSADFSSSKRQYTDTTRYLSLTLFNRSLPNGETRPRPWYFLKVKVPYFAPLVSYLKKLGSLSNDEGYND